MAIITGTNSSEVIDQDDGVTDQSDNIRALGGDDDVFGLGGSDYIDGGLNDDNLYGGEGGDTLVGGLGSDILRGENGDDTLEGGLDDDELIGGDGVDTAVYTGSQAGVTVNLADGTASGHHANGDTLIGIENLIGSGQADSLTGNELDNRFDGGGGADFLRGGLGDDIYVVEGGESTIVEDANAGEDSVFAFFGKAGSITMPENVENFFIVGIGDYRITATGTQGNDFIQGVGARVRIDGLAGNDEIEGDTGNDRFDGGEGHDTLGGGGGIDTLGGGQGHDKLNGGSGIDTMRGGTGNDTYNCDSSSDKAIELADEGKDLVNASSSFTLSAHVEDLVLLDTGNIDGTGNGSANVMTGNLGKNVLSGLGGNDTLKGGAGVDTLIGGAGKDSLFGGVDRDVFDFNSLGESKAGSNRDTIQDFKRGTDDIDLRTIDAKKGVSGNQKFKFIGKQDFHDKKGELRYEDKGSKVIVQGDVNGDGKADFEILVNAGSLSKGDFLL